MKLQDVLSEGEKQKLAILCQDVVALEAIRKAFLFGIYYNGTLMPESDSDMAVNFALRLAFRPDVSNEQMGADLKACAEGMKLIEGGIGNIMGFKPVDIIDKKEINEAR